jgi:hypothetical protein
MHATPLKLPPLHRTYVEQLLGLTCAVCNTPVPDGVPPLAEQPARYGTWRFTYRPAACGTCAPHIPRPLHLPALDTDPPATARRASRPAEGGHR